MCNPFSSMFVCNVYLVVNNVVEFLKNHQIDPFYIPNFPKSPETKKNQRLNPPRPSNNNNNRKKYALYRVVQYCWLSWPSSCSSIFRRAIKPNLHPFCWSGTINYSTTPTRIKPTRPWTKKIRIHIHHFIPKIRNWKRRTLTLRIMLFINISARTVI